MRKFLLALGIILGLLPLPAFAAISVTTLGTHAASTATTNSVTIGVGGVPTGALVVVEVLDYTSAGSPVLGTVGDTKGNSYTSITSGNPNSNTQSVAAIFYAWNITALVNTNVITYTTNASATDFLEISVFYATGIQTSSTPLDTSVTASAVSNSASPTVTSGTPGVAGELFAAALAANIASDFTQDTGNGWAAPFDTGNGAPGISVNGGNQVNAGSGTKVFSPTMSNGDESWLAVVGFKATAAAAAVRSALPLTGAGGGHG